jgi:hypothetical protein
MNTTIALLTPKIESTTKKLEALAKRAAKHGLAFTWSPISGTTTLIRETWVPVEGHRNGGYVRKEAIECGRFEVSELPVIEGHRLVARLEHTTAGNLVNHAPGAADLPEHYRTAAPLCEHCSTTRARKDTFVLQRADGSLIQIGRNCMADFLRSSDPTKLLDEYFGIMSSADPDESYGTWDCWTTPTLDYVAAALASIERYGFRKAGSDDRTTRDDANFLTDRCPSNPGLARQWREEQPTDEQRKRAAEIIAWAQAVEPGASDYLHNVRVACSLAAIDGKRTGILASVPQAYNRAMGILASREALAAQPDPGYFGDLSSKVQAQVTLLREYEVPNNYGCTTILTMRTPEGHELVWFASRTFRKADGEKVKIGETLQIKGTVKSHRRDAKTGRAQTVITRAKAV